MFKIYHSPMTLVSESGSLFNLIINNIASSIFEYNNKKYIYNNNKNIKHKHVMTSPLKGLSVSYFKNPLSQLRIPNGRRQTSWLFTKRGEFAPGITEDKFIQ